MADIVTEHAGSVLRVQFNRPTKRNAMTSAMYVALAGIFNEAANDENTRVVLWHGAGDSFCAGIVPCLRAYVCKWPFGMTKRSS